MADDERDPKHVYSAVARRIGNKGGALSYWVLHSDDNPAFLVVAAPDVDDARVLGSAYLTAYHPADLAVWIAAGAQVRAIRGWVA